MAGKMINVYKASAGSGKTYTLTHEYIDLILRNSDAYKHVLAVTFTNKATDEMKQRIIKELYKIAHEADEQSADTVKERSSRAREVLINILHDYSAFYVSTIDKFFQSVMRSFARELGRLATYTIELDADLVRQQAVDMIFADLDKPQNRELLEWLINFSFEKIEEGEAWGVKKPIDNLSESLLKEDFKLKMREFAKNEGADITAEQQRELAFGLKERIGSITDDFEKRCREIGRRGLDIMEGFSLAGEDFKGKQRSSAFKLFGLLASGKGFDASIASLRKAHNTPEEWSSKTDKRKADILAAYSAGLNDCVGELVEHFEQNQPLYNSAMIVKSELGTLGILGCVYANILQYCKEKNVMLLSETTELLNRIIDGSDTPFVYERIGCWINNFMLDEFQDTSSMQWENFLPLLGNSIAMGERNLIVGDVKQSIYRWRNSDWKILNSGIDEAFGKGDVEHSDLLVNWRSMENIVTFNNVFFKALAQSASELYSEKFSNADNAAQVLKNASVITGIYSGFEQDIPGKKLLSGSDNDSAPGYVEVDFIDDQLLKNMDLEPGDLVAVMLPDAMKRIIESGYSQRDVGVLVRTNREAADAARVLLEAGYKVISADSLKISDSAVVNKIVNILREIDSSNSNALKAYSIIKGVSVGEEIGEQEREMLAGMSLYQMCEEVIRTRLDEADKRNIVFIQSFLDSVLEFATRNGSTLGAFLKWWDESGVKKAISFPEGEDAVKIMTIHKSKGLAFDVVIMPYFKMPLTHSNFNIPLLWSNAAANAFGYKGPLPVSATSKLNGTLFEKDFQMETLDETVDALNMAYVAFTRPREELIVFAEKTKYKNNISDILYSYSLELADDSFCGFSRLNRSFELGTDDEKVEVEGFSIGKPLDAESNAALKEEKRKKEAQEDSVETYILGNQLERGLDRKRTQISLQSGSIDDELTLRDNGILMHDIFASINSVEDAERLQDVEIREQVLEMLSFVEERGWFSDKYRVYRECSIILPSGKILRPDRVLVDGDTAIVIDYKFGEYTAGNKKYHKQVQEYMQLLMDMGFSSVNGYLWYPNESVVETVSL